MPIALHDPAPASHLPPAFQGLAERRQIGVLDIAPHRQPVCDTGDPHAERLDQAGQIERRRLALVAMITSSTVPASSRRSSSVMRDLADPVERRQRALQDVIPAAEAAQRSTAARSADSSTMHTTSALRCGSPHSSHGSLPAIAQHTEQMHSSSRMAPSARASASTSLRSVRLRWNARRVAVSHRCRAASGTPERRGPGAAADWPWSREGIGNEERGTGRSARSPFLVPDSSFLVHQLSPGIFAAGELAHRLGHLLLCRAPPD